MRLIERILQRRDAGRTTCAVVERRGSDSAAAIVDQVVQAHGFRGIATAWHEISASDAHAIVTALLHRDLAYEEEIMSLTAAADLATEFFDLVPEPHAYFTNGEWTTNHDANHEPAALLSWDPISDAAFDSGVVCLGDGSTALFWIEDEE